MAGFHRTAGEGAVKSERGREVATRGWAGLRSILNRYPYKAPYTLGKTRGISILITTLGQAMIAQRG